MEKQNNLVVKSLQLIMDCCLENGAIVAANTDKEYYPNNVNNYRFVWPRDVAFILYALHLTGNCTIAENFCDWLLNRAEGFAESGVLFQRYATNGSRDLNFGYQYQPDQSGALLWALCEIFPRPSIKIKKTITLLANSLCANWNGKCFNLATYDLWEERQTFPSVQDNFVYTLAACGYGLECAAKMFNQKKWRQTAFEMRAILLQQPQDYYCRSYGKLSDQRIDASLFGLVWPFAIVPRDNKLLNTIKLIEKKLIIPEGVQRYENDEYDGTIEHLQHWRKGAGGWTLLMFWYVIVLAKTNRKQEAVKLFNRYCKRFASGFIPEQVFANSMQKSVMPLGWSHAMFMLAQHNISN